MYSNTYAARVLLKCLENIILKHDVEIILLSELGVPNDINIKIHVYESLQQCVEACTQILIVNNETIPKSKIDFVLSLANSKNKQCTTVRDLHYAQNGYTRKVHLNQDIVEKPSILIVSYGAQTQLSCWETLIYKLLYDNKFKVVSSPSEELCNVFDWLSQCNLTNILYKDMFVIEHECEVAVHSLQYYPNGNNEVDEVLYHLNPDVIIVSICNNYYNYDEIRNLFKFKYGRVIDIFAKSEILEMIDEEGKRKKIFDFSSFCKGEDSIISLNDPLLIHRLSKEILPKISLPEGVTIV